MGYIDKNLMEGERIIAKAHLHPIVLLWPVIVTLLFLLGGPIVILPLIWLAWAYWFYSSAEFAVTNRRIIAKWGVISSRHSIETNLDKVEGVTINQGILGSKLNYGSVMVRGTGGTGEPFPYISNPMAFRREILEHTTQHLKESIPKEMPAENV